MERRLEIDSPDGGMVDGELDNLANLVFIYTAFNRGDNRDVQADLRQSVQCSKLLLQNVGLAAKNPVRLGLESIELEIERWPDLVELFEEAVVFGDPFAVGVDHDERYVAGLRRAHKVDDLRVNSRLAAGELHHLGIALSAHVVVEHLFDFFQREAESRTGIGKAQGAIHIAGAVYFDNPQTGVLLMVWAQSAVVRTSIVDFAVKGQRDRPRFVVTGLPSVCLGSADAQAFEGTALRAALAHVDLVVTQHHLGVDHLPALGANAAGQFIEDVVGVLFHNSPNG